ncbi:hypothetical protein CHUV0807_0514 [Cardiobacterium hominis]|uniref:Uncharacterized protein n=1 Tax=Cardiobacterium hominis TaxID=2718 RepID=A0A1C3H2K8_9GAMM|nr:hypothetical protein CHUV0807_0514 [Cardiobacterium hominis]
MTVLFEQRPQKTPHTAAFFCGSFSFIAFKALSGYLKS